MINFNSFTEMDAHQREIKLKAILEKMDIPEQRRAALSLRNLRWLNRNMSINNSKHPLLPRAVKLLTWLLRFHTQRR